MKSTFIRFYKILLCLIVLHSSSAFAHDLQLIPYEEGFYQNKCYYHGAGLKFKTLYDAYVSNLEIQDEYLIPKLIHFVWLGGKVPDRCKIFIATWKKFHPDWTVKVWTDEDVESFHLQNQLAFDIAKNYGEKADIFRYEILYRHGGVYIDTDFECLKPLDDLHKSCEFYTGIGDGDPVELLNGIIGSKPGHRIMKTCIDALKAGNGDHNMGRIIGQTGPVHFTRVFLAQTNQQSKGNVVAFPPAFFYPMPNTFKERKDTENLKLEFIRPQSFGFHWWDVSWMVNIKYEEL